MNCFLLLKIKNKTITHCNFFKKHNKINENTQYRQNDKSSFNNFGVIHTLTELQVKTNNK